MLIIKDLPIYMFSFLILQLEGNIRAVALSPDWFKLVESWLIESSLTQSDTITTGSVQKRGLRGRRGRKPSDVSETTSDDQTDSSIDFTWWRGGMFSKLILQRGVLPHTIVKKTARQGKLSPFLFSCIRLSHCKCPRHYFYSLFLIFVLHIKGTIDSFIGTKNSITMLHKFVLGNSFIEISLKHANLCFMVVYDV